MAAELVSSARKNSLGGTGEAAGVLDVVFPLRSKGRDVFAPQNAAVKLSVQVFHEETRGERQTWSNSKALSYFYPNYCSQCTIKTFLFFSLPSTPPINPLYWIMD